MAGHRDSHTGVPGPAVQNGRSTIRGTIRGMAERANPAFAIGAVLVPVVALVYATTVANRIHHTYVHVMAGVLWTGIDLFMVLVLGPVIGGLSVDERANVFQRFTPKMTFLLPTLALVTIAGGITLAIRMALFPYADAWLAIFTAVTLVPALLLVGWQLDAFGDWRWQAWFGAAAVGSAAYLVVALPGFAMTNHAIAAALVIVAALSVIGFGVLMPGEVRMYREMVSDDPDVQLIGDIGMRNAKIAGVQGILQLAVVAVMVYIRWGGF